MITGEETPSSTTKAFPRLRSSVSMAASLPFPSLLASCLFSSPSLSLSWRSGLLASSLDSFALGGLCCARWIAWTIGAAGQGWLVCWSLSYQVGPGLESHWRPYGGRWDGRSETEMEGKDAGDQPDRVLGFGWRPLYVLPAVIISSNSSWVKGDRWPDAGGQSCELW
jgi:hypothetical protein